jgi:hypothetical protein
LGHLSKARMLQLVKKGCIPKYLVKTQKRLHIQGSVSQYQRSYVPSQFT